MGYTDCALLPDVMEGGSQNKIKGVYISTCACSQKIICSFELRGVNKAERKADMGTNVTMCPLSLNFRITVVSKKS